ncbi:MAG: C4-dicarboxylate ABC transporter permease [Aerococcus suis]|nr:C4-dicarboxylate ABC transporter permease [Aerococcus suis]
MKKKKTWQMPNTYIILLAIAVIMMIATWIIPAGAFERIEEAGRTEVVSGSFHFVDQQPQTPFDFFRAVPKGLVQTAEIVFFVLIGGGTFKIFEESGALNKAIQAVADKLEGREYFLIPTIIFIFSLGGGTMGLAEETLVFLPLVLRLATAVGYDRYVGLSMVSLGAAIGVYAGFMNPFSIGVAQVVAELPIYSGMGFRLIVLFVMWVVTSWYVMRYAKHHPAKENDMQISDVLDDEVKTLSLSDKLQIIVFAGGFAMIAVGVLMFEWFITELSAMFLIMGMVGGLLSGLSFSKIAVLYIEGARELLGPAVMIGLARCILVIMEDGQIIDTMIYFLTTVLKQLPSSLAAVGMFFTQVLLNPFIPSSSGLAAVSMPIMVPIADHLEVTRQTAVLAFQFGEGFLDSLVPTSGVLMAQLGMAKIDWPDWFKFVWKLIAIWMVIGIAFLLIANAINYGPY